MPQYAWCVDCRWRGFRGSPAQSAVDDITSAEVRAARVARDTGLAGDTGHSGRPEVRTGGPSSWYILHIPEVSWPNKVRTLAHKTGGPSSWYILHIPEVSWPNKERTLAHKTGGPSSRYILHIPEVSWPNKERTLAHKTGGPSSRYILHIPEVSWPNKERTLAHKTFE